MYFAREIVWLLKINNKENEKMYLYFDVLF